MSLTPHAKQREMYRLLSDDSLAYYLFYGGSRSGKTTGTVEYIFARAAKYAGYRAFIGRDTWVSAKASLWLDTIDKLRDSKDRQLFYQKYEQDHYIKCANGSEIWVDGLDDSERVEKILGREYNDIFINEVSKGVTWHTISILKTRLAKKTECVRVNKFIMDENPPSIYHFTYKVFIKKVDPLTGEPLTNADKYASLLINPYDNAENLPMGYIEENLEHLPELQRKRFLLGEFTKPEGAIFENIEIVDDIPNNVRSHGRHAYGLDFGYSIDPCAIIECYDVGDELWLDEKVYQTGLDNDAISLKLGGIGADSSSRIIADSAEPKSIDEIKHKGYSGILPCEKGADSIRYGIDVMQRKKIKITRTSYNMIEEFQNYVWKQDKSGMKLNEPEQGNDHSIDAVRYVATYFSKQKQWAVR